MHSCGTHVKYSGFLGFVYSLTRGPHYPVQHLPSLRVSSLSHSTDASEALALPGVVDAITVQGVPGDNSSEEERLYAQELNKQAKPNGMLSSRPPSHM